MTDDEKYLSSDSDEDDQIDETGEEEALSESPTLLDTVTEENKSQTQEAEEENGTQIEEEEGPKEAVPEKKKIGRPRGPNYKPRAASRSTEKVISEDEDTIVVMRNRGKPKTKRKIVVYREDFVDELPVQVELKSRRGRGRPKSKPVVEVVNESEKIEIERPAEVLPREPTEKEIKKLELQERLISAEAMMGRKMRLNKKGQVDGRMVKTRSEAQKKATEKMLLARKVQREIKAREKAELDKEAIDQSVRAMVSSLSKAKKEIPAEAPPEKKASVDLSIFD